MSIIRATVNGQRLIVTEAPELASGGKGTNQVAFEFDESWDGFTRTAVFYRIATEKKREPLGIDDVCDIPPEVIEKKGRMFFGVFGVDGEGRTKTSLVVPYAIEEGACGDGAEPSNPPTDFWEEVLAEIAKSETDVKEALHEVEKVTDAVKRAEELIENHAVRHSISGEDPIYPGDIGAARQEHIHDAGDISGMMSSEYDEETETLEIGDLFEYEQEKYYVPFVDSEGILSWSASMEGMPDIPRANIKGPKGDSPIKGFDYWTDEDQEAIIREASELVKEWADGEDGIGIKEIKRETSLEDGGTNVVTVVLKDGREYSFSVMNGHKGDDGKAGSPGLVWAGEWNSETSYTAVKDGQISRDVVMYNGSAYVVATNNSEPVIGVIPEGDTTGNWELLVSKGEDGESGSTEEVEERLSEIEAELEKINPFKVESFSVNPSVAELGSKVSSVVLSWGLNKDPAKVSIDGAAVTAAKSGSHTVSEEISGTRKFVISAESESGKTATDDVSINFYNGIYYGAAPETIQGTEGLTKVLSNSKKRTFTVTANEGEYIFYILPARLGEPVFKVGGFEGGFNLYKTIDFTNNYGYSESYRVYVSTEDGLGNITVEVS